SAGTSPRNVPEIACAQRVTAATDSVMKVAARTRLPAPHGRGESKSTKTVKATSAAAPGTPNRDRAQADCRRAGEIGPGACDRSQERAAAGRPYTSTVAASGYVCSTSEPGLSTGQRARMALTTSN